MSNYYVRARKRGTVEFRKAVVLDNFFGNHEEGYCFVDVQNNLEEILEPRTGMLIPVVYPREQMRIAGEWDDKEVGMLCQ